jgi:hypothetical protein
MKIPRQLIYGVTVLYVWVLMLFLGAFTFEALIIYANVFRDVPNSFAATNAFMVSAGPADFFRPIGMTMMLTGLVCIVLSWRIKSARYWLLASFVIILLGEFAFSALYFWPRNTIMFVEGTAKHSVAYLQQTAQEFMNGSWFRFGLTVLSTIVAFVGFLNVYRSNPNRSSETVAELQPDAYSRS